MSNKTQLQTNNDKLTSLIVELDNKTTGSSSSKETCMVDIASPYDLELYSLKYNNGTDIIEADISSNPYDRIKLTVMKPSMMYIDTSNYTIGGIIIDGDAEIINGATTKDFLLAIRGDCTIDSEYSSGPM